MQRILFTLAFWFVVTAVPATASAALKVTMSDGTTSFSPTTITGGFNRFTTGVVKGGITTLNLLACPAPCTVFFPSGRTLSQGALSTDTFRIADVASSPRARVVVTDGSTDKIELKGVRITSLKTGKTLRVTYETALSDLSTINSSSGTYPASVALVGSFKTSAGLQATACASGPSVPCASMSLSVNAIAVNGVGSNSSTFLSTSVPCASTSTTAPCAPAGVSGSYSTTLGTFTASDLGSISCGTTCNPVHRATITAKFNGANETLTLVNSGSAATATTGVEDPNSLIGIIESLEADLGGNVFVAHTGANHVYQVVPNPPLTNQTRNVNNSSTIPLAFELHRGTPTPTDQFAMISVADDEGLPLSEQQRNDVSYVSFIPSVLRFRDISTLVLNYEEIVGNSASGDARLPEELRFERCDGGSFRVDILLAIESATTLPVIRVYLGSDATTSYKTCDTASLSGVNLVADGGARVDTTAVGGSCCVTFSQAQGRFGRFDVRAVSVVVDQGFEVVPENHKVELNSLLVNAFSSVNALVSITNYTKTCDLPTSGRFMRITKTLPASSSFAMIVPDSAISNDGCKFSASVDVQDLAPTSGGSSYQVEMCLFGALDPDNEEYSDPAKWPGTCPATVGTMNLL